MANKDFEVKNGLRVNNGLINANSGVVAVSGNVTVSNTLTVNGGATVNGAVVINGNVVANGVMFTYGSATTAAVALGTISSSGTATLNYNSGSVFTLTASGALTLDFTNLPSGYWEISLFGSNMGLGAISIKVAGVSSSVNWVKGDGTSSTTFSTMGVTLQNSGMNHFVFWGVGSTIYGRAA